MNPQHTIPTMVDDGFVLSESRAMLMYLVNKYGENEESLYPSDPEKRALVDMRICFDLASLYVRFSELYVSFFGPFIVNLDRSSKRNVFHFSFRSSFSKHQWIQLN